MTCKEYLFKAHRSFTISYDDEETLKEIPAECRQRSTKTYTVKKDDYIQFERSMNAEPDYDRPLQNAGSIRGPQGKKGEYLGISFDSIWEYAYYRYNTEVLGNVVERNKTEWMPYYDETGKQRKFFYDFNTNGQPTEIKGIFRQSDILKMQATAGMVVFLSGEDIKPIMKELDERIPNWRSDYIEV